jgi:hypothetical protein
MSTRPAQHLPLDEFLAVVSSVDLHGSFIIPESDVAERLTSEVERKTEIKGSNLADEIGTKELTYWVSAKPEEFITQTDLALDGICQRLRCDAAGTFEITFHNTKQGPNMWGDRIWLGLRYTRRS